MTPPTLHGKPIHAKLVLANNFGYQLSDYLTNITAENIVLVASGSCLFAKKSINAGKSGAFGLMIYGDEASLRRSLEFPTGDEVPTVGISTTDVMRFI